MSAWQRKGGERHDHSPRRASPAPPSGGTHRLVPDPLATRDTDQASNLRAQPPPFRQPGEKSGLAPISGAHFNPAVSLVTALTGGLPWRDLGLYAMAQVIGGCVGTFAAHGMFDLPL